MIEEEVNRTAMSARSEYESAHANEDMLARSLEALKHNAVVTNEAMVTLRELERDVQGKPRAVYEASFSCAPAKPASRSGSTPRTSA